MSEEAVELVRSMYEQFNETGDIEQGLAAFDPDVEFEMSWSTGRDSPDFQVLRGIEATRQAIVEILAPFERVRYEVHDLRDGGEDVVAILELIVTPKGSSSEIGTGRFGYVLTVRGGKIVRVQDFPDPEEALRAAGLR